MKITRKREKKQQPQNFFFTTNEKKNEEREEKKMFVDKCHKLCFFMISSLFYYIAYGKLESIILRRLSVCNVDLTSHVKWFSFFFSVFMV